MIFLNFSISYLIYSLSKKPVEEPNDESADSVIAGIVEKILRESGIRGVVVNSRIINVFRKKISLLHSAFKKFSRRGGKSISKLTDSWKVKNYSFKIFYHELQSNSLIEENQQLRGQKRKAELDLAAEQAKRLKIEQKLEDVIRDSENRKKKQYKEKFRRLVKKTARMQKKGQRGPNKSKKFTDYTKQLQARIRRGFKEDCHSALSFLGLYDFIATKVEVFNNDTQQYETISLVEEGELKLLETEPKELTDNDIDDINMWDCLKDKVNISNEAWHELAMKRKDMPTKYKISKHLDKLNANWNLKSTPEEAEGIQISFKESLEEQIKRLQKNGVLDKATILK